MGININLSFHAGQKIFNEVELWTICLLPLLQCIQHMLLNTGHQGSLVLPMLHWPGMKLTFLVLRFFDLNQILVQLQGEIVFTSDVGWRHLLNEHGVIL